MYTTPVTSDPAASDTEEIGPADWQNDNEKRLEDFSRISRTMS
jgi:hypothetical protein